jgi:LCP family protein required for cell wall assembly
VDGRPPSGYAQPRPSIETGAAPAGGSTHSYATQSYGSYPQPAYASAPAAPGQAYRTARPGTARPGREPIAPAGRTGAPAARRPLESDRSGGSPLRTSHVDPSGGAPARGRHATGWDSGFDRIVGWTLLASLVPGSGLIASGRRSIGWLILGSCVATTTAGVAFVFLGDPVGFVAKEVLARPERLTYAAAAIVVLGVLWATHLVVTNLSLRRFASLTGAQSALSWTLVATLAVGGVGGAAMAGKDVQLVQEMLAGVFDNGDALSQKAKRPDGAKADPWQNTPRVNVLLIGSDAGASRTGVRADTIIVASVDTKTGETVLFSLPRNLEHVPFAPGSRQAEDYPDGFYSPDHSAMLNALWQFGVEHADQYYKGEKNPGLTATREGVEQALGLTIDEYAMVDLRGFMQFVDAIGGVTINVKRRIPVGGKRDARTGREVGVTSYIEKGRRELGGYEALWFARSRSDSDDFERMSRQRCVIGAITAQANPQTIALSLPGIMRAAKDNIRTSIPLKHIDAWATLALRVQKAHVRSLPFTNTVIAPGDPDFEKMRELVRAAVTEPPPVATPSPTPSAAASASPPKQKPRAGTSPSVRVDPEKAVDVKAVC